MKEMMLLGQGGSRGAPQRPGGGAAGASGFRAGRAARLEAAEVLSEEGAPVPAEAALPEISPEPEEEAPADPELMAGELTYRHYPEAA